MKLRMSEGHSRRIGGGRLKQRCRPDRAIAVIKSENHSSGYMQAVDSKAELAASCTAAGLFLHSLEIVIQQPSMTNQTHPLCVSRRVRSDDRPAPGTDDIKSRFIIVFTGFNLGLIVIHYYLLLHIKLTHIVLKTNGYISSSESIQLAFRSFKTP